MESVGDQNMLRPLSAILLISSVLPVTLSSATGKPLETVCLWVALSMPVAVAAGFLWTQPALTLWNTQPRLLIRRLAVVVACVSAILSVPVSQWPAFVAFHAFQPELERLAERVKKGEAISSPQRIGLFVIYDASISPDRVPCLWTDLNVSGKTGFIQCSDTEQFRYPLWSAHKMSSAWHFVMEE